MGTKSWGMRSHRGYLTGPQRKQAMEPGEDTLLREPLCQSIVNQLGGCLCTVVNTELCMDRGIIRVYKLVK